MHLFCIDHDGGVGLLLHGYHANSKASDVETMSRSTREIRVAVMGIMNQFPKSAPARFGCKQRKACNNTGVGYGGAVSTRSGGTPMRTVRAELACLSLSAARSGALLLKGPSSTEHWFPGSNLRSSKHPKL